MNQNLVTPPEADPRIERDREFWSKVGEDLVRGSIGTIDSAAKQILAVSGILDGLYFRAVTFSELRTKLGGSAAPFIYLLPIILLLCNLSAALLIFFRDRDHMNWQSWQASKIVYE